MKISRTVLASSIMLATVATLTACAGAAPRDEPERRPPRPAPQSEVQADAGVDAGIELLPDAGASDAGASGPQAQGSTTARADPARWTARACGGRVTRAQNRIAEATLTLDGNVRVRVVDPSNDAILGESVIAPPTWRTRAGADCTAMGIAGADLVGTGRALTVRVEVSVGDLCDRNAPRCTVVTLR